MLEASSAYDNNPRYKPPNRANFKSVTNTAKDVAGRSPKLNKARSTKKLNVEVESPKSLRKGQKRGNSP